MSIRYRTLVAALAAALLAAGAWAAEVRIVGTVSSIQMAADGKSATVVLQDTDSGADVTVIVQDDETLDKFKDQRIGKGDEIRVKYDNGSGRNLSKTFRKTAGC